MISLQKSIGNKVVVGDASRIQTDRIQNPYKMTCPLWNGQDSVGRSVCGSSVYTKMEGCNNAVEVVNIENNARPPYTNYNTIAAVAGMLGEARYRLNDSARSADMAYLKRGQMMNNSAHFGGAIKLKNENFNQGLISANARAQISDAAFTHRSRLNQAIVTGYQASTRADKITVSNPNGDYTVKTHGNGSYARLADISH